RGEDPLAEFAARSVAALLGPSRPLASPEVLEQRIRQQLHAVGAPQEVDPRTVDDRIEPIAEKPLLFLIFTDDRVQLEKHFVTDLLGLGRIQAAALAPVEYQRAVGPVEFGPGIPTSSVLQGADQQLPRLWDFEFAHVRPPQCHAGLLPLW